MKIYKSKFLGYVPDEDVKRMALHFDEMARKYHETSYIRASLCPLRDWEFENAAALVLTDKDGNKHIILCTVHKQGHAFWCTPIDTQHLRWVRPLNPWEKYAHQKLPKCMAKRWLPY